eukprot:1158498-Pyramimonas_sp.AAC.1
MENSFVAFLHFRFGWPSEASRWLQYDGPGGPARGPRKPQDSPEKSAQDRFKSTTPRGAQEAICSTALEEGGAREAPRGAEMAPAWAPWPQEGPKAAPSSPQRPPEALKAPKSPQDHQETPEMPPRSA